MNDGGEESKDGPTIVSGFHDPTLSTSHKKVGSLSVREKGKYFELSMFLSEETVGGGGVRVRTESLSILRTNQHSPFGVDLITDPEQRKTYLAAGASALARMEQERDYLAPETMDLVKEAIGREMRTGSSERIIERVPVGLPKGPRPPM